ncbi:32907_t:CDS:1, partial [Gigaspora margarita]
MLDQQLYAHQIRLAPLAARIQKSYTKNKTFCPIQALFVMELLNSYRDARSSLSLVTNSRL